MKEVPEYIRVSTSDGYDLLKGDGKVRHLARLKKARMVKRARRTQMVERRRRASKYTRKQVIAAIQGTKGILSVIALNLGCKRYTVEALLKRPGEKWDVVRRAYDAEVETGIDGAEATVHDLIDQKKDLAVAAQTAKWLLSRRRKQYADTASNQPVPTPTHTQINIGVVLDKMSVEEKRAFLKKMDEEEQKLIEQRD